MKKTNDLLKYTAFGMMGLYVLNEFKNNPTTLGSKEELQLKANKLFDKFTGNTKINPMAKIMGKKVLNDIITKKYDHSLNIRDVTPGASQWQKKK